MVVSRLCLLQRSCTQPLRQLWVLGFPVEMALGKGRGSPELLMGEQEFIQCSKSVEQLVGIDQADIGHGAGIHKIMPLLTEHRLYRAVSRSARRSASLAGINPQILLEEFECAHQCVRDQQIEQTGGEENLDRQVGSGNDGAGHTR